MLGMKKFFMSKMGDTKAGRAIVLKYAGESGDHTIKSLKSAAHKVASHSQAKDLKKKIMKLISKIVLLHEEGKISDKQMHDIQDKMHDFTHKAVSVFSVESASVTEKDIKELQRFIDAIKGSLKSTVNKLMQTKNIKLFDDVLDFYGSEEFLDRLIHDPDLEGEKASLRVCLSVMADPLKASSAHIPCAAQHCDKPRAGVPGSDYCATHHESRLKTLLKSPTPRDFLINDEYRKFLESFMFSRGHSSMLTLYNSCESYKKITNKSLLKSRAENIYSRHFASTSEQKVEFKEDETIVKEISDAIESDVGPSKKVFSRAQSIMDSMIDREFEAFIRSEQFEDFQKRCGPEAAKGASFQLRVAEGKYDDSDSDGDHSDDGVAEEKKK